MTNAMIQLTKKQNTSSMYTGFQNTPKRSQGSRVPFDQFNRLQYRTMANDPNSPSKQKGVAPIKTKNADIDTYDGLDANLSLSQTSPVTLTRKTEKSWA